MTNIITYEDGRVVTLDEDDSPELDTAFFAQAKRSHELPADAQRAINTLLKHVGRPPLEHPKQAVSVRLDADVLTWLKSEGKGYQSRINAILRQAMETTIS
jgi:uncharacterized protein (DUF4415 family)